MSTINYKTELNYIFHLARINGYLKIEIDNILKKHLTKKHRSEITTFFEDTHDSKSIRRICMPYFPSVKKKTCNSF